LVLVLVPLPHRDGAAIYPADALHLLDWKSSKFQDRDVLNFVDGLASDMLDQHTISSFKLQLCFHLNITNIT
jgi:hypothetical protein